MFKKIIKSILNLFLFSAIIHNCVLLFLSITNGDIKYLNYFRILSLDEFWPKITQGTTSDLISLLIVLLIFTTLLLLEIFKKKKKFAR
jgi:hypothetical protein